MSSNKYLIVIAGPTAVGKTDVAIKVAQHFGTEILSADSRQFYKEMAIGTAKPSQNELGKVPHHFIDSLSIHDQYSVGDFEKNALKLLTDLFKKNTCVVMAGGSGLFIKAVCEGLDEFPEISTEIRNEINDLYRTNGIDFLQKELQSVDPIYYEKVDLNNPMRLIRALEVYRSSGKPFSSFLIGKKVSRFFTPIYVKLEMDRATLYNRINLRVDQMIANGLEKEAKDLHPFKHLTSLQTVGYQELFDFFDKKNSLENAIELIKRNSRRYAKRQMTWLRKTDHWTSFQPSQIKEILQFLEKEML